MDEFQPTFNDKSRVLHNPASILLILLILFTTSDIVSAASSGWRLSGELIVPGDSKLRVLRIAGEPDLRETVYASEGGVVGQRWYYRGRGYGARSRILCFAGGRLVEIRTEKH